MAIAKEFMAGAALRETLAQGGGYGAGMTRGALWDALHENGAAMTGAKAAGAGASAGMAVETGTHSILESLASVTGTDRSMTTQPQPAVAVQAQTPTYKEVQRDINLVGQENLRHVSAPVQGRINQSAVQDRQATAYAQESTTAKLGQVAKIEQNLDKIAAAEAAGHAPADAAPAQGGAQPGMGVMDVARSAALGTAMASFATAIGGPVAGAAVGGAMMLGDFKRVAQAMSGGGSMSAQFNGQGSFGAKNEGTLGEFRRMSKAEARSESLSAEGRAPAAHSFDVAAKGAGGMSMALRPKLGDIAIAEDSLAGIKGGKYTESPQLAAMRDNVRGMRSTLEQQNGRARDLDDSYEARQKDGVSLDHKGAMDALDRGMDVHLTANNRGFAVSGMSA